MAIFFFLIGGRLSYFLLLETHTFQQFFTLFALNYGCDVGTFAIKGVGKSLKEIEKQVKCVPVLANLGCHNKIPWAGWPNQQKFIF